MSVDLSTGDCSRRNNWIRGEREADLGGKCWYLLAPKAAAPLPSSGSQINPIIRKRPERVAIKQRGEEEITGFSSAPSSQQFSLNSGPILCARTDLLLWAAGAQTCLPPDPGPQPVERSPAGRPLSVWEIQGCQHWFIPCRSLLPHFLWCHRYNNNPQKLSTAPFLHTFTAAWSVFALGSGSDLEGGFLTVNELLWLL